MEALIIIGRRKYSTERWFLKYEVAKWQTFILKISYQTKAWVKSSKHQLVTNLLTRIKLVETLWMVPYSWSSKILIRREEKGNRILKIIVSKINIKER